MPSTSPTIGTPIPGSIPDPASLIPPPVGGPRPGVMRGDPSIAYSTPGTRPISSLRRSSFSLNQESRRQLGFRQHTRFAGGNDLQVESGPAQPPTAARAPPTAPTAAPPSVAATASAPAPGPTPTVAPTQTTTPALRPVAPTAAAPAPTSVPQPFNAAQPIAPQVSATYSAPSTGTG